MTTNEPSNAKIPATISANRLHAGRRAVAVLFIVDSNMHALIEPLLWQKIRPKCDQLRTQPRRQPLVRSERTTKPARDLAVNTPRRADLSDRKHEDFGRSSGAPGKPVYAAAIGINHLRENFLEGRRCDARLEVTDDVIAQFVLYRR